jgi:hypothetical protein
MINVKSKTCQYENCKSRPSYKGQSKVVIFIKKII